MKKLMAIFLAMSLLLLCGCGAATTKTAASEEPAEEAVEPVEEAAGLDNAVMFDYMMAEFLKIAEIPRGSGNTDAVSDYLKAWGEEHGFETMQDEVGNIRWDVPATPGYEDAVVTALQAHMDMVAIADDDRDMTKSPIVVVNDTEKGIVSSDGHTSLGSDDGIGIVTAMYLATSTDYVHGPLRVIITINEEGGSPSGVGNMDHSWVDGVKYMVNIDSEDYATCTVAACGFAAYSYSLAIESENAPAGKVAYTLDIHDLKGGHSGVDIDKNRASAIKAVDYCLAYAKYRGIDVQLASFNGGLGMTAIPPLATAVVVFSPEHEDAFKAIIDESKVYFAKQFDLTEAGYSFTFEPTDMPESVLTAEASGKVIDLVAALEDGVNTISQRYAGITETSYNTGTIGVKAGDETFNITQAMRTSSQWPTMLANMQAQAIANAFGATLSSWSEDPFAPANIGIGWEEKEGDIVAQLYAAAFKEYTGDDCVITAVHGGLECADFAAWNDDMEVISVGPTVESPHSVNEYVVSYTAWNTCGAIATLISNIANGLTDVA